MLGAAAYEFIGLLIATRLKSLIGFLSGITAAISIVSIVTVLFLAFASPVIVQYLIARIKFLQRITLPPKKGIDLIEGLLPIWCIYLLFFLVANAIFFAIVLQASNSGPIPSIPVIFTTFTLAWLAGFITPDALAVLGVREGVMILILSRYIGEPASITISLLSRIVTTAGDLVFYFVGLLSGRVNHIK